MINNCTKIYICNTLSIYYIKMNIDLYYVLCNNKTIKDQYHMVLQIS